MSLSQFFMPGHMTAPPPPPHPESLWVSVTCSMLMPPPPLTDSRTNPDTPNVIPWTTQGPLSLIPWPETRFYPAVKAGRLVSTHDWCAMCNPLGWSGVSIMR